MPRRYPDWICADCGEKLGRGGGSKYATWHVDPCDVCNETTMVTEPRDFGHLKPNWREIVMGKELS
jgi:hypothetical protein